MRVDHTWFGESEWRACNEHHGGCGAGNGIGVNGATVGTDFRTITLYRQ